MNLKSQTDAKSEIGFPRSEAEKTISEMIVHGQEISTKYGTDSKKSKLGEIQCFWDFMDRRSLPGMDYVDSIVYGPVG